MFIAVTIFVPSNIFLYVVVFSHHTYLIIFLSVVPLPTSISVVPLPASISLSVVPLPTSMPPVPTSSPTPSKHSVYTVMHCKDSHADACGVGCVNLRQYSCTCTLLPRQLSWLSHCKPEATLVWPLDFDVTWFSAGILQLICGMSGVLFFLLACALSLDWN